MIRKNAYCTINTMLRPKTRKKYEFISDLYKNSIKNMERKTLMKECQEQVGI